MAASPRVVPCKSDGHAQTVTASGSIRHLCPFRDEEDIGRVSITWQVDGRTFELHELAAYLDTFRHVVISHEDLTGQIFQQLDASGIRVVRVVTGWVTAGLNVTVTRGGEGCDALHG